MKLYSRAFVRSLRNHALNRIRQNKGLRREHRRRRQWFRYFPLRSFLIYAFLSVLAATWTLGLAEKKPDFALIVISFYCTGTVVLRSWVLSRRLHGPGELTIFSGLPLPDREFFSWQWQKFLFRSGWVFFLAFLLYAIQGLRQSATVGQALILALLASLAQWILVVSLASLILNFRHSWFNQIGLAAYAAIIGAAVAPPSFSGAISAAALMLPAGWINRAYLGMLAGHLLAFLWVLPVPAIAVIAAIYGRSQRERYKPRLIQVLDSSSVEDMADVNQDQALAETQPEGGLALVAQDTAADRISFGELEYVRDWNQFGLIERVAGWCVEGKERVVAEFMLGDRLGQWSSRWLKGFYISCGVIFALALVPRTPFWLTVGAACIAGFYAAPVLGGKWLGFSPIIVSMKQSSVEAFYPVTYWQVSRLMFKINLLRLLAYSLLLFPLVIALFWKAGFSIEHGVFIATRILFWLAVLQFGAALGQHSRGTNDTKSFSFGTIAFFIFGLFCILFLMIGVFVSFVPEAPYGAWVGGVIVTLFLALTWWSYGLLYNRGRIDLIRDPDK